MKDENVVQPFGPIAICLFIGLGLALGVFAFLHQPGAPLVIGAGSNTAQVLEPLKVNDPASLKLFNN